MDQTRLIAKRSVLDPKSRNAQTGPPLLGGNRGGTPPPIRGQELARGVHTSDKEKGPQAHQAIESRHSFRNRQTLPDWLKVSRGLGRCQGADGVARARRKIVHLLPRRLLNTQLHAHAAPKGRGLCRTCLRGQNLVHFETCGGRWGAPCRAGLDCCNLVYRAAHARPAKLLVVRRPGTVVVCVDRAIEVKNAG